MSRWVELATWRGPTSNQGGPMIEQRGLVIHIAEGTYEGTIAWQRNPTADVSSHFVVAKSGAIAQVVDSDVTAWTQRDGNGHWLSSENEGFIPGALTDAQIEANARLFAYGHFKYGYPLIVATSPTGKGLGHHSMGAENGYNWGHPSCPGPAIVRQKQQIVNRAIQIVNGAKTVELTGKQIAEVVWNGLDNIQNHSGDASNPTWVASIALGWIVGELRRHGAILQNGTSGVITQEMLNEAIAVNVPAIATELAKHFKII